MFEIVSFFNLVAQFENDKQQLFVEIRIETLFDKFKLAYIILIIFFKEIDVGDGF